MNQNFLKYFTLIFFLVFSFSLKTHAFTRNTDVIFDGMSVEPDKFQETLDTIKQNKIKNKKITNPKKLNPDTLFTIKAIQKNPKNIQLEIDTSQSVVDTKEDIQLIISNQGFLNAVTEAIMLWDDVDIADISFAPVKFTSSIINPDDGKNVITFRAAEAPEGAPEGSSVFTVVNTAHTDSVIFMNSLIMAMPGTILDADIVFDPSNDPCLAFHTTTGPFKIGGDNVPISEGGPNPAVDLSMCDFVGEADLTDLTVRSIARVLGLASSAIASSATSAVSQIMTRYALTSDDKIALANLYPNKEKLTNHGTITGKVILDKKPIRGVHVVLEDSTTGEPVTSTITNLTGRFIIKAIPAGTYNVYAEPVDGPIRKNALRFNFFGSAPQLNFTTGLYPTPVTISANKKTKISITVKELSASAFNINHLTSVLTEKDVNDSGGSFLLPIRIMAGETLSSVKFWGDNISKGFGTLSISGSGITVSNVQDVNVMISPFFTCKDCDDTPTADNPNPKPCKRSPLCALTQELDQEPDQIVGIQADIKCDPAVAPGPRNIIFTGDKVDPTHPSFGLRDQITGGIIVTE